MASWILLAGYDVTLRVSEEVIMEVFLSGSTPIVGFI